MSYGEMLRQARTQAGLTLQQLSAETRIRPDYLAALEDENLGALPERPFTRSFLQQYARALKLDPAPLLAELDEALPRMTQVDYRHLNTAASRRAAGRTGQGPGWGALPLVLAGLALLGGAAYFATRSKTAPPQPAAHSTPAPDTPPSVNLSVSSVPGGAHIYLDNRDLGQTPLQSFPVEARRGAVLRVEYAGRLTFKQNIDLRTPRNLQVRLMPANAGPSVMKDNATGGIIESLAVPAPKAPPVPVRGVTLRLTSDSWLRVTAASGRILFEGMAPAGSTKTYDNGVTVRAGNAGAVRVSVDGGGPQVMGADGQVVTKTY